MGLRVSDDVRQPAGFERDEMVTVATLRQGRLPHLQREFRRLATAFEAWLISDSIKRGEPLRVFWVAGEPGPERSKGRLACLSRAVRQGRAVDDATEDLAAGARPPGQESPGGGCR